MNMLRVIEKRGYLPLGVLTFNTGDWFIEYTPFNRNGGISRRCGVVGGVPRSKQNKIPTLMFIAWTPTNYYLSFLLKSEFFLLTKVWNSDTMVWSDIFRIYMGTYERYPPQNRSPHTMFRSSFSHHIDRIWQVLQWKYLLLYLLYCVVSYLLHCVSETAVIVAKINTNISSH